MQSAAQVHKTGIEYVKVSKWFGNLQVLKDINLTVSPGERVVICVSIWRNQPLTTRRYMWKSEY